MLLEVSSTLGKADEGSEGDTIACQCSSQEANEQFNGDAGRVRQRSPFFSGIPGTCELLAKQFSWNPLPVCAEGGFAWQGSCLLDMTGEVYFVAKIPATLPFH